MQLKQRAESKAGPKIGDTVCSMCNFSRLLNNTRKQMEFSP